MLIRIVTILGVLTGICLAGVGGAYFYLATSDGKRAEPLALFGRVTERPLTFAHRGGAQEAPENTIPAFETAADNGVDVLELDVHMTSDGEIVVFHDSLLDRTTNRQGPIAGLSLEELKEVDAGYSFTNDGGRTHPFRGTGVRIPTLREVFEAFPQKFLNIEVKSDNTRITQPLCRMISDLGRKKSVIVASAGSEILSNFRMTCPDVATSASFDEIVWFMLLYKVGLTKSFTADMQALQIPEEMFESGQITKDFIAAAKERNLEIHIWTANKKDDIQRLLNVGVDGVMTDRPSLIAGMVR